MSAPRDTPAQALDEQAAATRNSRDWKYFDERLTALRVNDVESILARGRLLIEAHDELEHGSYEATVKRHMDLGDARKYRAIAAHSIISNRGHVHALPPSMRTLYELTRLRPDVLREKLNDGSIHPKLERKTVAAWRNAALGVEQNKLTVDGKTVEAKLSVAEQLRAARTEIETLKAKLKNAGSSLFDLALDSAEEIGKTLADNMSEGRFDTAMKAAKARYKAKRQKPAG
jgi:hypothetical protein